MAVEIIMPKVDMVMETGTFVEWLKKEGETVKQGEPLFVIMTDKSAIEVEAPGDGILAGLSAVKDDVIPVSQTIGYLLAQGESLPAGAGKSTPPATAEVEKEPVKAEAIKEERVQAPVPSDDERLVRATPLARSLAKKMGIDLASVKGRGERGRIYKADILAYQESGAGARQAQPLPAAASIDVPLPDARVRARIPLKGPRAIIAKRLSYSASTIPHIYESVQVDMTEVIRLRERIAPVFVEKTGHKPSYTAIMVLAVAKTLPAFPSLNASLAGEEIVQWEDIHIGIATDIEDYLIVPVLREAQKKNLEEIVAEMARLLDGARAKRLEPKDMTGSTFSISNLGMFGIQTFTAIINPPEAAILAVGAMTETPRQTEGRIEFAPCLTLTIGVDHRVTDGATAARFLVQLKKTLENPYLLL